MMMIIHLWRAGCTVDTCVVPCWSGTVLVSDSQPRPDGQITSERPRASSARKTLNIVSPSVLYNSHKPLGLLHLVKSKHSGIWSHLNRSIAKMPILDVGPPSGVRLVGWYVVTSYSLPATPSFPQFESVKMC